MEVLWYDENHLYTDEGFSFESSSLFGREPVERHQYLSDVGPLVCTSISLCQSI